MPKFVEFLPLPLYKWWCRNNNFTLQSEYLTV